MSSATPPGGSTVNPSSSTAATAKPPASGNTMTQADLRSALQTQLRASGVADELKAQLRAKIISHLNGPAGLSSVTPLRCALSAASGVPTSSSSAASDLATNNLVHTVANALVADYLAAHDLNYTLSVYLPETTQAQPPSMDIAELQELLHLSSEGQSTSLPLLSAVQQAATQSSSILEGIVRGIRILNVHKNTQQTQTDTTDTERTLREYADLVERERDERRKALLEQARKHDLVVEDRVARELELKLEAFRATELKRLQVEARESILSKLEDAREATDRKHQAVIDKLRQEMDELQARTRLRETDLENQLTELRARLARELKTAQAKEDAARSQHQVQLQAKVVENDALVRQVADLKRQVVQLAAERDQSQERIEREVAIARNEANHEQAEFLNNLKLQEAKLQAEQQVLDERRRQVDRYLREEDELKRELATTRRQLEQAQAKLASGSGTKVATNGAMASDNVDSTLQREIAKLRAKLDETVTNLHSSTTSEQVQMLKMSEQKWQNECQGLISRLEREYRRSEDLERQLMLAKNAKQDLKMEVMHLRVLVHQLSSTGRVGTSGNQGDVTNECHLRFLPDPMMSTLSTTTTTAASPPRQLSRRGRRSSSRDSATARSKHSNPDSSAMYSPMGMSDDEGNGGADFSPTSRESLISDISSAELRILRHKANDMGIAHVAGRSSRELLVPLAAADGDTHVPHTMRRRLSDSSSPLPVGSLDHDAPRRSLSCKRQSASVVILNEPVIIGNASERPASPERSGNDTVPCDLSASERRILSRRASRDHLASISPTPSTHASHSIIDDAAVGLGLTGGNVSPLPIPLPELTTTGDNGEHVPHDLSNSEIKILQRRASRDLGLDAGDSTPTGTRSPVVFDETVHINGEKHSSTHLVRTKSSESVISDLSNAELRLLQENAAPGYSKPLADVDAVPRRVHMSKESLVSDLSHTEKKLLVKSGSHSARSSTDDLLSNHGSVASSSRPSQSGVDGHGHGSGHERKVVILARDMEVDATDPIPTGASRESLSSALGARHVAFSTTDEEHEVDTEGAIRKVAFGASKEHVVDTRDPDEENEAASRPRVVSFEEGIHSPAHDHATVTVPMRQSPSPITAAGTPSAPPAQASTASAKSGKLQPPPLNVTGPVTQATQVPQPESPLPSPKLDPKPTNTLEAKAQAITTANPQLLTYMSKAASAGAAASSKTPAQEPSEDASDFGAGDTISAASGTTATGTSS